MGSGGIRAFGSILKRPSVRRVLLLLALAAGAISVRGDSLAAGDIAEARLFDRAVAAIEEHYVAPERVDPRGMLDGALNQMQRLIPEILVNGGGDGHETIQVGFAQKRFRVGSVGRLSDLKGVMREVLSFVAANYHGETPAEEIEYAAIDGMLEVLDPHSNFMPPKVYKEFQVGTRGKFGGLGIVIALKDGNLTVVAPIDGTPAARAGIRAGDRILQIGDESTISMSLTDAVNRLRGDVGSKIAIIVEKPGKAARRVVLTRAMINIESVQHSLLAVDGKRIGYIKVKNFQSNTDEDVGRALAELKGNGALDGLILDVRNNPGGLLNVAVELTDRFLNGGTIVTTVGARDRLLEREDAHAAASDVACPLIVLVNEGSASASEIVAGAIQANGRAPVMGIGTFGKGSVQTIVELGEGSALKLTVAQYKPAGTLPIQLVGVTPDIGLEPATVDRKAMNLIKDVMPSEFDLERHLDGRGGDGAAAAPRCSIRYLKPAEDEKEREERSAKEYSKEPDISDDFAVSLARDILARAGKATRDAELAASGAIIKQAGDVERERIVKALSALGVDWSDGRGGGEPKLSLAYHLRKNGADIKRARAGDKIELFLTASNVGTGRYSRLIAVGQSEMPFLSNLEFPFGLLPPGGSKSWGVPIELPEALPRQDLTMEVSFEDGGGKAPKPLSVVIPIEELPQPAFAFSLNTPLPFDGGKAKRGKAFSFSVGIVNQGAGATSDEAFATVSNECGDRLFIEEGRVKLGVMQPKARRQAAFRFHAAQDLNSEPCAIKLTIADAKRFLILTKKFDLLARPDVKAGPGAGGFYQAPSIALASAPPTTTAEERARISGVIKDADPIRDYFIFVGKRKIAYAPNPEERQAMQFDVSVPLEPGFNQIAIGARDGMNLLSRKLLVIERTSGERKKRNFAREMSFAPDIGQ